MLPLLTGHVVGADLDRLNAEINVKNIEVGKSVLDTIGSDVNAAKNAFDLADEGVKAGIVSGIRPVSDLSDEAASYVTDYNKYLLDYAEESRAYVDSQVNEELALLGVAIPVALGAATVAGGALAGHTVATAGASTTAAGATAGAAAGGLVGGVGGILTQAAIMIAAAFLVTELIKRFIPNLVEKMGEEIDGAIETMADVELIAGG